MIDRLRSLFQRRRTPVVTPDTIFVWEPCSHSHAEVVPGYCKLIIDAGYEASVLVEPARLREGLFARFHHARLHLNPLSRADARHFFAHHGLAGAAGVLVTTADKITTDADYVKARRFFGERHPRQKVLLVEHDVGLGADRGTITQEIITLRPIDYRQVSTTPINPHFFGAVAPHPKNPRTTFAVVGAVRDKRRNFDLLLQAVETLHRQGLTTFTVVVIGKKGRVTVPAHLAPYVEFRGRVPFSRLYDEVESCDFLLPLLDPTSTAHRRYLTTGTSGTFQLSLGFTTPCLVERSFASVHRLTEANAIVYDGNEALASAMADGIHMTADRYRQMCDALATTARSIEAESLANLKALL